MNCVFNTTTYEEWDVRLMVRWYIKKTHFTTWDRCYKKMRIYIDKESSHRIKACGLKWHQVSSVLCDPRVSQKLKVKFYRNAIWPTMLCEAEYWLTKRRHVQQLSVTEMHMLQWVCGHTRRDCVWNNDICERLVWNQSRRSLCNIIWDGLNISNRGPLGHWFVAGY
jgi:hypothetical protein